MRTYFSSVLSKRRFVLPNPPRDAKQIYTPPPSEREIKQKNQVFILYFELFGVILFVAEVLRVLLSGFCPSPSGSRRIGGGTRDGERWEGGWRDKRARFLYNYSSHVPADLFTAPKKKGGGRN